MPIQQGDTLPGATLLTMTDDGPERIDLSDRIAGRRVVIFGLPGAYTGTCSTAHVPSFLRTKDALMEKGVDEIICVSVNDPFVMRAWAKDTGAEAAGLTMLADPDAAFTTAIGMEFSAPPVGLVNRSQRYAMLVEAGVVKLMHDGDAPGECNRSSGETMLDAL